jgi:LysR family transcriptional regulator, hydrogen peroxide-inducible genes activator
MSKNRRPSIRQLEYFVSIAKSSNFRKAAEKLGISQPTLTSQILSLEKSMGVQLFERSRAGTLLSPRGRELLPIARKLLEQYQQLVDQASLADRELSGTFKLGVSPTIGPYMLPAVFPELHQRYSNLRIHVREHVPRELEAGLDDGSFDLILTVLPMNSNENQLRPLFIEPIDIVISADHPLVAKESITARDLVNQDVLSIDNDHHLHHQIANLCERFGAHILRDQEANSLAGLKQMAMMGMGIAFLPSLYVRTNIHQEDRLKVIKLKEESITRTHVAAWRRNAPSRSMLQKISYEIKSIAIERFSDILAEVNPEENF